MVFVWDSMKRRSETICRSWAPDNELCLPGWMCAGQSDVQGGLCRSPMEWFGRQEGFAGVWSAGLARQMFPAWKQQ